MQYVLERVTALHTLRASLSGTFLRRKDVVNQCLEFVLCTDLAGEVEMEGGRWGVGGGCKSSTK